MVDSVDSDTARAVRDLARELAGMQRRIARLEAGQRATQLDRSSIENGQLTVNDNRGRERSRLGLHTDGTFALTYENGPQPRTPSAPSLIAAELSLVVFFDGADPHGRPMPADVERVDIHESETAGFTADGSTVRSSVPPGGGARLLILDNQAHHVQLVAVSTSNVASEPSAEVSKTPLLVTDLDADALSGKVITGATIRTADSGQRLVLSAASNALEGYDSGGNFIGWLNMQPTESGGNVLGLRGAEDANNQAGTLWQYPGRTILGSFSNDDSSNSVGSLDINQNNVHLRRQVPSTGGDAKSGVQFDDVQGYLAYHSNPAVDDERAYFVAGDTNAEMAKIAPDNTYESYVIAGTSDVFIKVQDGTSESYVYLDTSLIFLSPGIADTEILVTADGGGNPRLYGNGLGTGLVFASQEMRVYGDPGTGYDPIRADSFINDSSRVAKTNVTPLGYSALEAVLAAPVSTWQYREHVNNSRSDPPTHVGPMAEDLPPEVAVDGASMSINDGLGLLWQAVRELDAKMARS